MTYTYITIFRQIASATLTLRNWMEVRLLFVDYLVGSDESPYAPVDAVFVRDEFQDLMGNLPHIHMLLSLDLKNATVDQQARIDDLIRADVGSIVRSDEVQHFIDSGVFKSADDQFKVQKIAREILPHLCSPRCLVRTGDGDGPENFKCRSNDNLQLSPDITRNCLIDLPMNLSIPCMEWLICIGMLDPIEDLSNFLPGEFKATHTYFHPKKHIPKICRTLHNNISPVEGFTFAVCLSMQNLQCLIQCNGCTTYCNKYIVKIDKMNYVIVLTHAHKGGTLMLKSKFLHNTKIATSAHNEAKAQKKQARRGKKANDARAIGLFEQLCHLLGYQLSRTDIRDVEVPTIPFENRVGYLKPPPKEEITQDGAELGVVIQNVRIENDLPIWRRHSDTEVLMLEGLKESNLTVDRITVFSVRPPELRSIFDQPGNFYRWFEIEEKCLLKRDEIVEKLSQTLKRSIWINGFQRQVYLRIPAISEVMNYLNNDDFIDRNLVKNKEMIQLLQEVFALVERLRHGDDFSDNERSDLDFYMSELLYDDSDKRLPIPLYSFTRPSIGEKFILHILLSLGHFATEWDLLHHRTIRESFRYAKLIRESDDEDDLKHDINNIMTKFIEQQLVYFPNSHRQVGNWIALAGESTFIFFCYVHIYIIFIL